MKRIFLTILLAMPLLLMAQGIAVYDAEAVFNDMTEKTQAEAKLKATSTKLQAEYKQMQEDFNRKYADYQALAADPETPAAIKERRMQEIQESDKKIQDFQRNAEAELQLKRDELIKPLRAAIDAAVKEVGDESGFAVILDSKQVSYRGASTPDVTARVKAKLGL